MTHNLFTIAILAVLLAVLAARPDTPAATTPARAWSDLRAAGWRHVAWTALRATLGTLVLAVVAAVRTGTYGTALAIAAAACLVASLAALDRRPVRVRRGAGVWA